VAIAVAVVVAGPAFGHQSASASVEYGTLTITGSGAGDAVAVRLAEDDPRTLEVDLGDDGSTDHAFDRRSFSAVDVFLGDGDDQFRVDESNGGLAGESLIVTGGRGDDDVDLRARIPVLCRSREPDLHPGRICE
jgi:hypothetical protein